MRDRTRCSHLTLRGRPCRNAAALGTRPPACALHRRRSAAGQPVRRHFYFPNLSVDELRALEEGGPAADLQSEIALVRLVLRRVLAYLDETAGELPAEEIRRLTGLVFSGARTVAHLLAQRSAQPDEVRNWLDEAAATIAAEQRRGAREK